MWKSLNSTTKLCTCDFNALFMNIELNVCLILHTRWNIYLKAETACFTYKHVTSLIFILLLLPIHTLTHPIPSRSELGSRIPPYLSYLSNLSNHTLAFLPFPLHRCLVYDGEILNYHTLHCGPGVGGEFTPHIITSGNPHDPGFGPEAKSPRGEITHHLATLLSPFWYAVMPLPTRYGMIW